jgi:SAM-dependent methyltransferase
MRNIPLTSATLPHAPRRAFLARSGALAAGSLLPSLAPRAQAPAAAKDDYEPQRGQIGKDVMWIATPDALVTRMLRMAAVTADDYVIDLGSGDGKIVIAAAREFGARGKGIEYNADLVELSKRRAREAGVAARTQFEQADIFDSDFSRASVITMYLLPELNLRLRPRILALKPGTRIVSHSFLMGRWQPDETSRVGTGSVHLWLVPVNAGGEWELTFPQRGGPITVTLKLTQTFQDFTGEAQFKEFSTRVRDAKVAGGQVRFAFIDEDGRLRRFEGEVTNKPTGTPTDDRITGSVFDGTASAPFSARRIGAAPAIGGSGPASMDEAESLE